MGFLVRFTLMESNTYKKGGNMIDAKRLKNPDILKRKPKLKLCSNHFLDLNVVRVYDSLRRRWVKIKTFPSQRG